ncbi:MAG: hypothetical protein PHC78_05930 [Verrucomicrobiota bacterium]|nr:hypothetical protein [Verrucomicrobiota bacterium]
MDRSNFAAELCPYRNNTDLLAGFSCPNPIPRTFDTETDSDPDSDPDPDPDSDTDRTDRQPWSGGVA